MLTGLDATPWAKLSHAYGKATDVPKLLRALLSASAPARAKALGQLEASICHQGTLFSATPPAIPFLIELAGAAKVKDKPDILSLLSAIATLDDHGQHLLDGFPSTLPKTLPAPFRKSLLAVRAGNQTYAELLRSKEADVRAAAAFLIAWLPDSAAANAPLVKAALAKEKDKAARVTQCLSLAYVARALGSSAYDATFDALLADKDAGVSTAAALAIAHTKKGKVSPKVIGILGGAAAKKRFVAKGVPWVDGDLAFFATRVLAALPRTDEIDGLLVAAVEAGPAESFAANVIVRRLFATTTKKAAKLEGKARAAAFREGRVVRRDEEEERALAGVVVPASDLDERQRRVLVALAADTGFDGDLSSALEERGLPATPALMTRYLAGSKPSAQSILDRELVMGGAKKTFAQLYVEAIQGAGGVKPEILAALLAATTPEEQIDLAMTGLEEIDNPWSSAVALELMWAAAPKAKATLTAALARSKRGATKEIPMAAVAVGVGLASAAIAAKKPADPLVDGLLQQTYGFWPRVRDALAALPMDRREKWALNSKRDDQKQPAEFFKGAWPYWAMVPTRKVTDRALKHVATWKPKDPWGGPRKKYADPLLVALIEALRAAGNKADAARCEAALASLGG